MHHVEAVESVEVVALLLMPMTVNCTVVAAVVEVALDFGFSHVVASAVVQACMVDSSEVGVQAG